MIDPYTMQRLNAERLKDLDRESAGLHFSCLAPHNRRWALKAARRRLVDIFTGAGDHIQRSPAYHSRRLSK